MFLTFLVLPIKFKAVKAWPFVELFFPTAFCHMSVFLVGYGLDEIRAAFSLCAMNRLDLL